MIDDYYYQMETIMKHKIRLKDKSDVDLWPDFVNMSYEFYDSRLSGEGNSQEIYKLMQSKIYWLKDVSFDEMRVLAEHIYNDGEFTIYKFLCMNEQGQQKLHDFLENSFIQKNYGYNWKEICIHTCNTYSNINKRWAGDNIKTSKKYDKR